MKNRKLPILLSVLLIALPASSLAQKKTEKEQVDMKGSTLKSLQAPAEKVLYNLPDTKVLALKSTEGENIYMQKLQASATKLQEALVKYDKHPCYIVHMRETLPMIAFNYLVYFPAYYTLKVVGSTVMKLNEVSRAASPAYDAAYERIKAKYDAIALSWKLFVTVDPNVAAAKKLYADVSEKAKAIYSNNCTATRSILEDEKEALLVQQMGLMATLEAVISTYRISKGYQDEMVEFQGGCASLDKFNHDPAFALAVLKSRLELEDNLDRLKKFRTKFADFSKTSDKRWHAKDMYEDRIQAANSLYEQAKINRGGVESALDEHIKTSESLLAYLGGGSSNSQ